MLLEPKKMKYRKWQKGRTKGKENRGVDLAFGAFGLKSLEAKWIKSSQIEAGRKAITKALKRKGKTWIRIFPYKPVTQKGAEVGMGGGKGALSHYVFPIRPGRIIYEIDGVEETAARLALKRASAKLPVRTRFIKR